MKPEDFFSRRGWKSWAYKQFRHTPKYNQKSEIADHKPPTSLKEKILTGLIIWVLLCCLCGLVILFVYLLNMGLLG